MSIEPFQLFKYPWSTEKGVLHYSFYWILLIVFIYIFSRPLFFNFWMVWIIIWLIFLASWLFKRINYIYFSNKLHVVFAITIDYENKKLLKIYKELINHFKESLKDYKLSQIKSKLLRNSLILVSLTIQRLRLKQNSTYLALLW